MAHGKFVSYLRVSTEKQGRSGLGLEAQREAVSGYLNGGQWSLVAEVVEVESGGKNDRVKLGEALRLCRLHNATLVIAKLDRLSRDAAFLLKLEGDLKRMGLRFVAADMPDANELTIHIMAVVAQAERQMISARTKAALAAAKVRLAALTPAEQEARRAQGKATKLGGDRGNIHDIRAMGVAASVAKRVEKATQRAEDLGHLVVDLHANGASLRQIAADLNGKGIETARGGRWSAVQVSRVLARLDGRPGAS